MSDFTAALHRFGLLGDDGAPSGPLGLLGDVIRLPFDALRGSIAEIRARPQILRMALEGAQMRRTALQRLQDQYGTLQPGGGSPSAGMTPGGIDVQGAGQGNTPFPQDGQGGIDMSQMPTDATIAPTDLPPAVQAAQRRPDYRAIQQSLSQAALMGVRGAGEASTALDRAAPHMEVDASSGQTYDRNDPSTVPPRFRRPQTVGGANGSTVIDIGNPDNDERFIGNPPFPGAEPMHDSQGRFVRWVASPGSAEGIGRVAGAERRGQTENSISTVTGQDGRPRTGYNSELFGSGVVTGPAPGDNDYAQGNARAAATRFQGYVNAGQAATGRISQLETVGGLLDGYDGNILSPTGVRIGQVLRSMGVNVGDHLSQQEAAEALGNALALSLRSNMPGPLSNADRDYLGRMVPGLSQTAEGRRQLIEAQMAMSRREVFVAHAAQQWQQRYGRIDAMDPRGRSFEDQVARYNQANPIFRPRAH